MLLRDDTEIYINELNKIISSLKKMNFSANDFKSYLQTEDYIDPQTVDNYVKSIHSYMTSLRNACHEIIINNDANNFDDKHIVESIISKDVKFIDFRDDEKHIKIVFSELLPTRVDIFNKLYTYKEIDDMYSEAFNRYFLERNQKGYQNIKEKVMIEFKNYYSSPNRLRDHDNTEVKPFIDFIKKGLLYGDNPELCSLFCDYGIDKDNPHTEIYIMPEKEFFMTSRLLEIGDLS